MTKLILYDDGGQAVIHGCTIERNTPIKDEIELTQANVETIVANRRSLKIVRDPAGRVTAVTIGKKRVAIDRDDAASHG